MTLISRQSFLRSSFLNCTLNGPPILRNILTTSYTNNRDIVLRKFGLPSHNVATAKKQLLKSNLQLQALFQRHMTVFPQSKRPTPSGSPIRWLTVGVTVAVGSVLILLFKNYSQQKEKRLDSEVIMSYGRPELGGDFQLINQDGRLVSNSDFIGQWLLLYFGFTHCPDICPEELEKMGSVINTINRSEITPNLQPVFISIDPERDTPEAVKTYIADFHPNLIGLTGTRDQVDDATKAFRVYYSQGPKDEESDYLVDHTVIMYLIDDEGNFCEYFGQNKSAGEIASTITAAMLKSKFKRSQS